MQGTGGACARWKQGCVRLYGALIRTAPPHTAETHCKSTSAMLNISKNGPKTSQNPPEATAAKRRGDAQRRRFSRPPRRPHLSYGTETATKPLRTLPSFQCTQNDADPPPECHGTARKGAREGVTRVVPARQGAPSRRLRTPAARGHS